MKTTAAALLVITSMTAQAAEPETLTLACEGTVTGTSDLTKGAKKEPISRGIIVDFKNRTVQGFAINAYDSSSEYPVRITGTNDVTVTFSGSHDSGSTVARTDGTIDRVTGAVEVTEFFR